MARHLVIPTLITDFHREGIFRPSGNRKRLSSAPTLTLTLTLEQKNETQFLGKSSCSAGWREPPAYPEPPDRSADAQKEQTPKNNGKSTRFRGRFPRDEKKKGIVSPGGICPSPVRQLGSVRVVEEQTNQRPQIFKPVHDATRGTLVFLRERDTETRALPRSRTSSSTTLAQQQQVRPQYRRS